MEEVIQARDAETRHYSRFQKPYDALQPEAYRRILEAAGIPGHGVILDLGGGSGSFGRMLQQEARHVAVCDLSRDLLASGHAHHGEGGLTWLQVDIARLPFRDGSIDAILLGSVLHHFRELNWIARECHRCLKPGGWCATADPNGSNWMMWLLRNEASPFYSTAGRSENERCLVATEVSEVFARCGFEAVGCRGVRGVTYRLATFCAQEENPPWSARLLLAGWNALERILAVLPAAPFWLSSWMVFRFQKPHAS